MSYGRSRQLIHVLLLMVAVAVAAIVASAALRYNRSAGWFDARPVSGE